MALTIFYVYITAGSLSVSMALVVMVVMVMMTGMLALRTSSRGTMLMVSVVVVRDSMMIPEIICHRVSLRRTVILCLRTTRHGRIQWPLSWMLIRVSTFVRVRVRIRVRLYLLLSGMIFPVPVSSCPSVLNHLTRSSLLFPPLRLFLGPPASSPKS
jgi:hypothetical protein